MLDHFYSNDDASATNSYILLSDISDHLPIATAIKNLRAPGRRTRRLNARDLPPMYFIRDVENCKRRVWEIFPFKILVRNFFVAYIMILLKGHDLKFNLVELVRFHAKLIFFI